MSLLFFLKPQYPPFIGAWIRPKRKVKKRRVYKVIYKAKQAEAQEIDYRGILNNIIESTRVRRLKEEQDFMLMQFFELL